jgi:N6-L-threonylcarbamoyladenine synthase
MYVLGIETSCDETAASIVKDGEAVLSNVVSSSLKEHKKYGGVVPEIAFRMHLESITGVVDCAIKEAKIKLKNINLVSVTCGPGLAGSLLVGISFAKSISLGLGVSLLGVNHLHSHIYANFLSGEHLSLPFVALVVSGGHTTLFYVKDFDKIDVLGATCDDACGEAFDKVAKILRLGYPGGPLIERLAKSGNPKMQFSCSNTKEPLDFSFSGIKTAVLYYVRKNIDARCSMLDARKKQESSIQYQVSDVAASFQEAVINTLISKSLLACKIKRVDRLVIGGGVAANTRLRERFYSEAEKNGLNIYFPHPKLCMDNAAMVAGLGYQLFKKGYKSGLDLNIDLN